MFPYTDQEAAWLNPPKDLTQAEIMLQAQLLRAEYFGRLVAALVRKVADVMAPLARLRERQRMADELNHMSDRELADIGITRSEIDAVLAGEYADERVRRKLVAHNNNDRRRLAA